MNDAYWRGDQLTRFDEFKLSTELPGDEQENEAGISVHVAWSFDRDSHGR
jgi:hypothetical protein